MTELLTLDNARDLDDFVRNHPRGHYMQTTLYGRSRPDYKWNGIVIRGEDGKITASIALHSQASRFAGMRLFYAPRGPVFTTKEQFRAIIKAAREYCRENKGYLLRIDPPVSAEDDLFRHKAESMGFRFDPRNDYTTYQPKCVYQTKLTGLTESELLSRFHSETRYNIRLAQRRGIIVREGSLSDLPVFQTMMEETGKRDGFVCKPAAFYENFLYSMGKNAHLLLAEKDGRILAGAIEVILGKKAWYVYGCSFSEGREDMPNYLLQWEMMCYALMEGCTVYDFRGVEGVPVPENPRFGLHRFKQGFDAGFIEYAGQMDLAMRPLVYWLMQCRAHYCSATVPFAPHCSKKRRQKTIRKIRLLPLLFAAAAVLTIWTALRNPKEAAGQVGFLACPEVTTRMPNAEPSLSLSFSADDWRLRLVNKTHILEENVVPELKELSNGLQVDSRCYPDLQEMMDDCRNAGRLPVISSAYRTFEDQRELYENKIEELRQKGYPYEDAKEMAGMVVAPPGTSEHHTGLALDIVDRNYQLLDDAQEDTDVQRWLIDHSWEYGFVLRYPNTKSDVTGIVYEPWHYRYVGRDAAREIHDRGLCLEEFLELLSEE